jgi:hypothetical protein
MPKSVSTLLASACLATCLAGCVTSDLPPVDPRLGADIRITLPMPPEDVGPCLRRSFPEIPDRALTRADVVRIIGQAKVLDRAKTACGERAVRWIEDVRATFAR